MTWTIPDQGEPSNDLQAVLFQSSLDAVLAGHRRTGVFSGCAVSQRAAGANMSVDVAAGTVVLAGTTAAVAATNVAIGAADATNPRLDLIVSDGSGTLSVIAGTAAAAPKEATLDTTTSVLLAQVYVPAAATTITTARITDRRVDVKLPSRSVADVHTDATAVSTTALTTLATLAIPSTVAAGDILRATFVGDLMNNSGGAATYTYTFTLGATNVVVSNALSQATSVNRKQWRFDTDILVVGPTNDQRMSVLGGVNTVNAGFIIGSSVQGAAGRGTSTEDLTAGKNLVLAVTMSVNSASTDCVLHEAMLEVVKR